MRFVLFIIIAYLLMEFVAWFTHKYIMHGFMWYFHKDHHFKRNDTDSILEKNDIFFLVYAIPAIILILIGTITHHIVPIAAGIGATLYGLTYFLIHDVIIHNRLPILKENHNFYLAALIKAHLAHHSGKNIKDYKCFGLLIFPFRFLKK